MKALLAQTNRNSSILDRLPQEELEKLASWIRSEIVRKKQVLADKEDELRRLRADGRLIFACNASRY